MFLFLHFYYGISQNSVLEMLSGLMLIVGLVFALSFISMKAGNGFRSAVALTFGALALDFFYRGNINFGASHVIFDFLSSGPAAINFCSLGLGAMWMVSQLDGFTISDSGNHKSK
ncbi:MAG: hypothetical protein V2I38_16110 [Alcanivoracaceae bacterium]|nr:hypothetical protein [Alcanivoracaceae bacterium]